MRVRFTSDVTLFRLKMFQGKKKLIESVGVLEMMKEAVKQVYQFPFESMRA